MSFYYEHIMDFLESTEKMSPKKARRNMLRMMENEDFFHWLFHPAPNPKLNEMVTDLYVQLTRPTNIRYMIEMLEREGYRDFNRSHATFLFSICNIAISSNNEKIDEIKKKRKHDDISGREASRLLDKVDRCNEDISKLLKMTKKIIKPDAKKLARYTKLPLYTCMTAYYSVPETKYVDRVRIGYYLNTLLNDIYSEVEENGEFGRRVYWKDFFREIFGKNNTVEVATFILLEGVHRIEKYRDSDAVKDCWNSLTNFALKELNDSPEQVRQQMIELYIKRIDQMFANKSYDLRVNLLSEDFEYSFPKIYNTVGKYASRIKEILNRHSDVA